MLSPLDRFSNEALPPGRIALVVAYQGSLYHGWQIQESSSQTVQAQLQTALGRVAAHQVSLSCAGRTDAGVHASAQVVHFDTTATRSAHAWVAGSNHFLPSDIVVRWAGRVSEDFHARYSATAREYRYVILNQTVPPAQRYRQSTWIHYPLDAERMHEAAQLLVGTHDFSALRASECQSKTPVRELQHISVRRQGHHLLLEVKANAFLHHMVRNIVGTLLPVGEGVKPVEWVQEALLSRDRRSAGVTAPAHGLYLVRVDYPEHFGIPLMAKGPDVFSSED